MDLPLLIPLLALATGLVAVLKMPREAFLPKHDPHSDGRVEALEDEVDRLRGELASTQERLDFTEQLLEHREAPQLPASEPSTTGVTAVR
jgi:hypothetical protein